MTGNERQSEQDPREYWRGVPKARARMSNALRREYRELFRTCKIRSNRLAHVDSIVSSLKRSQKRYAAAGRPLGIPWYVVGVIHNMEGAMNFRAHLHNGDPLTDRTTNVPRGRPRKGKPPFNTGAIAPAYAKRGCGTFLPVAEYPARPSGGPLKPVAEITVVEPITDIAEITVRVERWQGSERVGVVWERGAASHA